MSRRITKADVVHGLEEDKDLELLVFKTGKAIGWTIPDTVEEVKACEERIDEESVELPATLRDPYKALARLSAPTIVALSVSRPESVEAVQNLARAAREGGAISSETEERMRRDRKQAEAEIIGVKGKERGDDQG